MALLVCVIGTAASKRVSAMSRKILIVLVAAAALNTGASANALAKGGVVHLFTHPLAVTTAAVTAMPITRPTAAIRPRDVRQHHAQSTAPELLQGVF